MNIAGPFSTISCRSNKDTNPVIIPVMTTVEAIYENGIFKPISELPKEPKEHDRVRITIETNDDQALMSEFAEWEAASERDLARFEASLGEIL